MRAEPIEIYVPCDVLTVKVRVGPHGHLSSLEDLFLRAVNSGASHFQELVHLFGIGHRPTLDLIFDLWHRGYLVLDLARGAVHLSASVSKLIAENRLHELSGGEGADEVREIMLDKLSGHVLPVSGRRGFPPSQQVAPAEHFDIGAKDISTADLIAALRRVVDVEERLGRSKRVLSAHLSFSHLAQTPDQRWLPLYVTCTSDEESGGLNIRLINASGLPASARTKVVQRLMQLVEDQPESPFAKYLRQDAVVGVPSVLDVHDLLSRLEQKTRGLAELDPGLQQQYQEQLDELGDEFEQWYDERRSTEVDAGIVVGHSRHSELALGMIRDAYRQVVIVCPWLDYNAFHPMLAPLERALDRGVQVFLLWGLKPDDELDQRVRNAVVQLRQQYPAHFFVSQRSSRTHAKLIIQDDRKVLATSLNFLSPSSHATFEMGVLLQARADGARLPSAERILDWARGSYPEFTPAQSMYLTRAEFSRATFGELNSVDFPARPVRPTVEGDAKLAEMGDLSKAAARLWQLAWNDYSTAAKVLSVPQSTSALTLIDGEHREVLWRALRDAKRRLLIVSDQLGPEVVNGKFLRRLEERLTAGVLVTLIYRRPLAHVGIAGADPEADLTELQSRFPTRFRCLRNVPTHAKILAFDDVAIVSSFNFLSFEGVYEERRPGIRRKQRSEIGIMLSGAEASEQVFKAVQDVFVDSVHGLDAYPAASVGTSEVISVASVPVLPETQQELIAKLWLADNIKTCTEIVRDAVAAASDPWWLLDRFYSARLSDNVLRLLAAAVLSSRWSALESEAAKRWLHWLAKDAWSRQLFVETATLCSAFPNLRSADVPDQTVAMLAAARAVGMAEPTLSRLSTRIDLPEDQRFVVAGIALVELMLGGSMGARSALESHVSTLSSAWSQLAQMVESYWNQTYDAVPIDSIRAEVKAAQHREAVNAAWAELQRALAEGASTHFKFESGTRTREYLYHANGPLGRLDALVHSRDGRGVASWLRGTEHLDDLDEFLDNATRTATGRDDQLFERGRRGGKRRSYLGILSEIVAGANTVARLSGIGGTDEESLRLELARPLARGLLASWSDLEGEIKSKPPAERVIMETALHDIRIIADWGAA